MLLSARMSAITARAPALSQMRAKARVGVAAADKADRHHAGGMGRRNPGRRILDHDALGWADAHLGRDVEEQVRRGLAAGNVARRKQIRLEEPQNPGAFEADPDTVERRGGGHAFRPAQPGQSMLDMGGGAKLRPQPPQRGGGQRRGEIRRQLALRRRLDIGEHVGRAPAGKETGDDVRRDHEAGTRQLRGRHFGHDRFAVDQHAVAVKDEHRRSPARPVSRQRCLRA